MEWRSVTRVWSYTITEKKDIVLFMWGFVKCNECKTHRAHRCICMCATVIFLFLFFCLLCSSLFPSVIMGQASILAGLLKRGLLHFVSRKKHSYISSGRERMHALQSRSKVVHAPAFFSFSQGRQQVARYQKTPNAEDQLDVPVKSDRLRTSQLQGDRQHLTRRRRLKKKKLPANNIPLKFFYLLIHLSR